MSRRSTRLVTTPSYQGDEDDRASTSSAGSSLLGGSQSSCKESPLRSFRKKSSSVKRSSFSVPPDTHQSTSYYKETTFVSSGLSGADYSSLHEEPLEKESYWEKDLTRQRRMPGSSHGTTTNGLADAKVTYDTYGSSSGYSSEEDYTASSLSGTGSVGSGFTGAVSKASSFLWQVITSPGRAFGLLYWLIGTAWYRLTTSASLLDVFVLTRSALKKTLLLLLLLLFLAAAAWGVCHFYPVWFPALRTSPSPKAGSQMQVPPVLIGVQNTEDGNSSLLYQSLITRLNDLEQRFQILATDSSNRNKESPSQSDGTQQIDTRTTHVGLTQEEIVVLLEQLMSQKEATLREDLGLAGTIHMQGKLEALREDQQKNLQGVLKQVGQLSKEVESQMSQMRTELKSSRPQGDQMERYLQEISGLENQLAGFRLELETIAQSQRGIATQVQLVPEQIQGVREEMEHQFPEWIQRLLIPSQPGTRSLSEVFLHRDELQEQLVDLERRILASAKEQKKRSSQHASARVGVTVQEGVATGVTEEQVHEIVNQALNRFSEDRIGLVDYALESSGASVISTRCSETYETKTALLSLFGIPLWYQSQSPRVILQPDSNPGNCWAFRGSQGFAVVRLSSRIRPTAVTLEHVPRALSPKSTIPSAHKDFAIYGHEEEAQGDGTLLGQFTYDQDGDAIQTFWFQDEKPLANFQIVELKILSNWGHPEYTCIYRFRVHGEPEE